MSAPEKPSRPVPNPGVMDIAAYVPGKSTAKPGVKLHKLSSNETPLGPSPAAIEAYKAEADTLELYPDGSSSELRKAIAEAHGLNPDNLICGNGSDELLGLLAHVYLEPGDEAIFTEHGFLVYKIQILANGATPMVAPETDLCADVDAILDRVTERTKMVFLANPNNPTGTYISDAEVKRLHAGLPKHVLLVIDAAYAEYVRRNDYSRRGSSSSPTSDNVIMTRTFSKIHGLANAAASAGCLRTGGTSIDAHEPHPRTVQRQLGPAMAAGIGGRAATVPMSSPPPPITTSKWLPTG